MLRFRKIKLSNFVFEVTPNCNHKCVYCYNFWKYREYKGKRISLKDWEKIIEKLKKETKVKLVSISGGEPLLYKKVFELIKLLREYNIEVNFLTNASLVNEKCAKKLVDLEISLFEVPLQSSKKEVFEKLTKTKNYEKVLEGIVNLSKAGGKVICVFVATKYNLYDLKETLELSIALGAKALMFNRINPAHKSHIKLMPSVSELKKALDFLEDFSEKYNFPISCSIPIQPCLIDMKKYKKISYSFCPSGNFNSYYTIDFFGNVRICNHIPTILGNLLKQDFSDIIKNKFISEFKVAKPNYCANCDFSNICFGGCKASAQVCYGSLWEEEPFLKVNKNYMDRS